MFLEVEECDELVSYNESTLNWYRHDNPYHMPSTKDFILKKTKTKPILGFVGLLCEQEEGDSLCPVAKTLRDHFQLFLSPFVQHLRQWDL